jgi:hypothetical protein
MIDLELVMKCSTCYWKENGNCTYKRKNNLHLDVSMFDICLLNIPAMERSEFVHSKYPNHFRPYERYKYIFWKPKCKNSELLLNDKDFEL